MTLAADTNYAIYEAEGSRPRVSRKGVGRIGKTLKQADIQKKTDAQRRRQIADPSKLIFTLNDLLRIANNRKKFLPTQMRTKRNLKMSSVTPNPASKSITFRGVSDGVDIVNGKEIPRANKYIMNISFFDISFSDKQDKRHKIKVKSKGGMTYYIPVINREKNPVQVRCQCFTGDTLIPLLKGTSVPIKSLVGQEDFYVYSYDGNKFTAGRAHSCRKTGEKVPVVKVTFDNGKTIRCTDDHRFLMASGEYKEVKDIKPNESLRALYRKVDTHKGVSNGYEQVWQKQGYWDYTHQLTDAYSEGVFSEEGTTRQHKDWDKRNNDPRNLEKMDSADYFLQKRVPVLNHKIVGIKHVGEEDVYCFTVDDYKNFVIDVDEGIENSSGVVVHNCEDFNWSFSWWDKKVRALLGQVVPKVKNYKVKGTGMPRNPGHFPSFCKHLWKFSGLIRQKGFTN